jgi:hypothetical protein
VNGFVHHPARDNTSASVSKNNVARKTTPDIAASRVSISTKNA